MRRRKELIFEIGEDEKATLQKPEVVFHMTKTIQAIDPSIELDTLPVRHRRGTKSPFLAHGEITERIYDAFRLSEKAIITSAAVAQTTMHEKGLDPNANPVVFKDFENRIRWQLNALRREGTVEKLDGRGPVAQWKLIRKPHG